MPPDNTSRSSRPQVLIGKGVLKISSKFIGEHSCRSVISVKLLCNFIEITLWHECSPVIFCIFSAQLFLRTPVDDCFCTSDHSEMLFRSPKFYY